MFDVSQKTSATKDIDRLNEEFVDYVNFGGFPELVLNPKIRGDMNQFIGNDIIDKVLLRDLPSLYGIQDTRELNQIFTVLAYNIGNEVNVAFIPVSINCYWLGKEVEGLSSKGIHPFTFT